MKKLFLFLCIAVFVSCSSDDDNGKSENEIKIERLETVKSEIASLEKTLEQLETRYAIWGGTMTPEDRNQLLKDIGKAEKELDKLKAEKEKLEKELNINQA